MKTLFFTAVFVFMAGLILSGCGRQAYKNLATAEEQFNYARAEYDSESYLKSIDGFQRVIFNFPGATVVDTAQYYLALSYFGNEEYELAAVEFRRLMSNYPRSDFVENAQYMSGMCYMKNTPDHYALDQEDLKIAIKMLEDFIIDNPDSPLVEDTRKAIDEGQNKLARKEYENGVLYFKMYDYQAASIYFQLVIDDYTNSSYAALSLFKLSEIEYKKGEYAKAMDKFKSFVSIYPNNELIPTAEEYIEKITGYLESSNETSES